MRAYIRHAIVAPTCIHTQIYTHTYTHIFTNTHITPHIHHTHHEYIMGTHYGQKLHARITDRLIRRQARMQLKNIYILYMFKLALVNHFKNMSSVNCVFFLTLSIIICTTLFISLSIHALPSIFCVWIVGSFGSTKCRL